MRKVKILEVKIDNLDFQTALKRVEEMIKKGGRHLIVTPYSESIVFAQKDLQFRKILNSAALSLPDGIGLIWASKILGFPLKERITGVDLMLALCRLSVKKGFKIFLLGGHNQVAERTADCLKKKFRGIKIAYFEGTENVKRETNKQLKETIAKINKFSPDLLFVAYGPVVQEKWLAKNLDKLNVKVAMGVGGAFDFISGRVPRAPKFIQKLGLEWLFRLFIQPWRVKRQMALLKFVWLVLRKRMGFLPIFSLSIHILFLFVSG